MTGARIEDLDILDVWRALGGGPLRGNRGRAFWRDGDGLNICFNPSKGVWFDQARGEGGGIVKLVQTVLGCDRRGAGAWLGETFGLPTGNDGTPEERRERARRIEQARVAAAMLVERRDEHLLDLRVASGILMAEFHRLTKEAEELEDIDLLARAEACFKKLDEIAARRDRLEIASGPELVAYFGEFYEEKAA